MLYRRLAGEVQEMPQLPVLIASPRVSVQSDTGGRVAAGPEHVSTVPRIVKNLIGGVSTRPVSLLSALLLLTILLTLAVLDTAVSAAADTCY